MAKAQINKNTIIIEPTLKKNFDEELKTRERLKQRVNDSQKATITKLKSLISGKLIKSIKTDVSFYEILMRSEDLIEKPRLYWQGVPGPDIGFKYNLVAPFSYNNTDYELAFRINKDTETENIIEISAFSSKINWHPYNGRGIPYSPRISLENLAKEVPSRIIFSALKSALQERLDKIKDQNTSLQSFLTDRN